MKSSMVRSGLIGGLLCAAMPVAAESMFPLWGDQAREQGIELPLPYGLSVGYMDQSDVTQSANLRSVKLDGSEQPLSVVSLDDSEVDAEVSSLRFDVWVLPFLNVYALGGKMSGTAVTPMTVDLPLGLPTQEVLTTEAYEGTLYGGGLTLVYGYQNFIASLDVNYTQANLDLSASKIDTLLVTPRIGFTSRILDRPFSLMLGASYMDLAQTITVEQDIGDRRLTTLLDIDSAKNWNTVVTAQLELDKHWQLVLDAGFNDRNTLTGSLTYRF